MAADSNVFEGLIKALSRLPGVGRRSAERMAISLVEDKDGLLRNLGRSLQDAYRELKCCSSCGMITRVSRDPCRICSDGGRDHKTLCVVEHPSEIMLIERSGAYRGKYHALMGKLSAASDTGPEDLRIKELLRRIENEGVEEVILALNTNVESDATASFLCEMLTERKVSVSRLAFGLPVGSSVMYSDPVTLARAMKGRQKDW